MASHSHRYTWFCFVLLVSSLLSACRSQGVTSQQDPPRKIPEWIAVHIAQEGVYRIQLADIQKAGLEIERFAADTLVLWRKGEPVPFQILEDGLALVFYAPSPSSPYTPQDVYWLLRSEDLERISPFLHITRLETTDNQTDIHPSVDWLSGSTDHILQTIRLEENQLYSPQVEAGDRWMWQAYAAPKSQFFTLDLPSADVGPGRLEIRVWARTEGPGSIDHHWEFMLNGKNIGDESWDGQGVRQFEAIIPPGILKAGDNQLEIRAVNDTGLKADIVYLDWIRIDYTTLPRVRADRLVFQALNESLKLQGFSGPVTVFRLNANPSEPSLQGVLEDGATLTTLPGQYYWLAGPESYLNPQAMRPGWIDITLVENPLSATYLAIGPQDLLSPLEALLQYHTTQGLISRAIPVDTIYNQFNGGVPEPVAILNYLKYAAKNWPAPPRYLLLVGDSTYDPHGYLAVTQANRLPTFFVDTIFGGQTASDVPFTLLDEDELSDLAVGRVPALTAAQVQKFVTKTLAYLRKPATSEPRSILAIADGQDLSFSADANRFLDQFPDQFSTRLLQPPTGTSGAAQDVISEIRQGHWLVAYFGHGSIDMWGKDHLLTTADVSQLYGAPATPVLVNMTCLTGLFTHPEVDSLAEVMLFQESGGAVVVLAPTSLTLPGDQSFLTQALGDELDAEGSVIIGDVLLQARWSIPLSSPGAQDVLLTFLLFGDPALWVH